MNSGAYSDRYKIVEREHINSLKNGQTKDTLARGKKLSQENYRRRRALAIKRKLEAQKEERRRQQILAQRREKQREATERFQRRNKSYRGSVTPDQGYDDDENPAPGLDEALRAIRGSPIHRQTSLDSQGSNYARVFSPTSFVPNATSPSYNSKSDKYAYLSPNQMQHQRVKEHPQQVTAYSDMQARSLRNLNTSRNLFEQQLHQQQQLLVEQQEKSLHDFNTAIMQEMLNDKKLEGEEIDNEDRIDTDSVSSEDSLNHSQDVKTEEKVFRLTHDEHDFSLNKINNRNVELDRNSAVINTVQVPNPGQDQVKDSVHEQDPSIYRTSAFQIHNKAWINNVETSEKDSNVLTSNSKPNSLRTTSTNATATHPVEKKTEGSAQDNNIQPSVPLQTNNSGNVQARSPQVNDGNSKYSIVQNGLSLSQLRQPTVYSRIATKESVKHLPDQSEYHTPNVDDRIDEESIQDDVSSINSTMSNTKGPEPDVKVLKSILKKSGPSPVSNKSSGYGAIPSSRTVIQKSSVRDSLEINKKVLETKHERLERKKSASRQKGVRFADLVYDDDSSSDSDDTVKEATFPVEREEVKPVVENARPKQQDHRRPITMETLSQKPPRPISARVAGSTKQVEKSTRVSSAPTTRRTPQPQGRIVQHSPGDTHGPPVRRTAFGETPQPSLTGPLVRQNSYESRPQNGTDVARAGDNRQYVLANSNYEIRGQNGEVITGQDMIEMNGLALDRTPTDAEINWLWDKVRTCLNRESSTASEASYRPSSGRLYIDGNTLNPQQRHVTRVAPSPTQTRTYNAETISSSKKRAALLQQRSKQQHPNTLKTYNTTEAAAQYTTTYQYPSPSSQNPTAANQGQTNDMSESMAAFLTAETLSKHNVSDSQIHIAMDSVQRNKQPHISPQKVPEYMMEWNGQAWVKTPHSVNHRIVETSLLQLPQYSQEVTTLSLEEQRLMQSLERLNERLRISEVSASPTINQPNVFSPKSTLSSGFKGHQPLSSQRRTSADGRRNVHSRTGSATSVTRTTYARQY